MGEEDLTHGKREGAKVAGHSTRRVMHEFQKANAGKEVTQLLLVLDLHAQ